MSPADRSSSESVNPVSKKDNVVEKIESISSEESDLAKNPFLDPKVADYYRNVYEKSEYECRHVFDPHFTWTEEEERKVKWKLEWRVAIFACTCFVALQIDRGNLGQAVSDNMLDDLNMTTDDYNYGNTIFKVAFLCAELPSQLVSKKIGPDRWIPAQMILWSIVAMAQAGLSGRKSFFATRAMLGLLEGGFIPDMVLFMSYFYTAAELSMRLAWFWCSLSITGILTSILAFAILHLRGVSGWGGWQWLFLLEGLFTLIIGIMAAFIMVPSAVQTQTRWNKDGWLDEREQKLVVNRILRDDPSKGDMNNRQAITIFALLKSMADYDLWPIYIIGLLAYVPTGTVGSYLSLTLRHLGFSTFNTNLLGIPSNVIHIINLLLVTWLSERVKEISLVCLTLPFWTVPLFAVIRWWSGSMVNPWGTWAVCVILLGYPYIHAICVSWCSRNSNTIRSRTVSAALYNICVQLGDIVSSNIYRSDDAPYYHRGNRQLFFLAIFMIPIFLLTKVYYVWRNHSRDQIWNAMSEEEKETYLNTTKDEGNKRLDFRFAH